MTPRTAEQNQQLRSESVRRLLAAARVTFARLGFDRATIRDIAQEAGVAQGLLYNYFRSKDDLLREVFREGVREVALAMAPGTLEQVIRRSFELLQTHRDFWQLSYMVRHQPRTAEVLGDELHAWAEGVRGQLEALLRDIGHADAPVLARVLFGAIDGVAQHYVLHPDAYPLAATTDCLVRQFCRPPDEPPPRAATPARRAAKRAKR